jgi:large subunit ribosomal protein L18
MKNIKEIKRDLRRKKTRKRIVGTKERPRLVVFRSLKSIYAQVINDTDAKTIASSSSHEFKGKKLSRTEITDKVGELVAKKTIKKGIKKVVFDKAGYKYHGRVKILADSARKAGLKF